MDGKYFTFFALLLCSIFLTCISFRVPSLRDLHVSSDPDTYLTTPKIIRRHGYAAEAHIIQSEDGYLLEYHRIPHPKGKKAATRPYPILLHHGLLCSSIDWVVNGPGKSLAYRLADEGYDVWLANARGNTYSRSHISMDPSNEKFWDFTFHEMGVYDVAAAIDYILTSTDARKIIYMGHSLGTTTFYAFATGRPEYSNKVLAQISIAPVGAISHTTSIFRALVPFAKEIRSVTEWYNRGAFLEHDILTSLFCKYICGRSMFNSNVCEQLIIFNLFGKDKDQFNTSLIPLVTSNIPAGTSGKNIIHCSQLISSGRFQNYDYGVTGNIKRYKNAKPPHYNISGISIPIKFFYSKNDILADPTDVELLYQEISKPLGLTMIDYEKWNHVDYLWAIDVNKYFNNELLEFLDNVTSNADFIMQTVEKALMERDKKLAPHDFPFNVTNFKHRLAQLPGLSNFTNNMDDMPNQLKHDIENGIESFRGEVDKKINEVEKAVNESLQNTARSINDGIQRTGLEVQKAIQVGVSRTEEGVNTSVKQIEQKMKEAMDNLARVLES